MARNVRGPMSALTDFLQSTGITPTTVARRVRTRQENGSNANANATEEQPEAGPSNAAASGSGSRSANPSPRRARARRANDDDDEYDSDNLDEPEAPAAPQKKQKLSKAAEAKLKAKEKAKAKKKKKEDDDDDSDEDAYTALAKTGRSNDKSAKPPVGSFEDCAKCEKQFTVTKTLSRTRRRRRKRKAPVEKRTVAHIEKKSFPTLVSLCIDVIARHIDDVEAFGDIGALNLEAIAKALSKNRRLTGENAHLFYDVENTNLRFYDATNLNPNAFIALGNLNPNLTSLRLDFCGTLNDEAITSWNTSLPSLVSLELLGPFLVREAAWITFLACHPNMEAFIITQSPRFSLSCLDALLGASANTLRRLGLREVGLLSAAFIQHIIDAGLDKLTYLDIAEPSASLADDTIIALLGAVGSTLEHLDLSGHSALTDAILTRGIVAHNMGVLTSLGLAGLTELSDAGVARFFDELKANDAPGLLQLDMARNHELKSAALAALIAHSGATLVELNINGWKEVDVAHDEALGGIKTVPRRRRRQQRDEEDEDEDLSEPASDAEANADNDDKDEDVEMTDPRSTEPALPLLASIYLLRKLDVGWCRAVDDFVVKGVLEGCPALEELKVWGCNRVEGKWEAGVKRRRGVKVYGIESQAGI
ncbi:Dna dependent atpase [Mycena kentingensis (nom. inval.)]|nr:Dna dependent atpase [Mycena kentingensis (nom. inval.)]